MKRNSQFLLVITLVVTFACSLPVAIRPSTTTDPTETSLPPTSMPTAKPLNLTRQPLYWFAPLPAKTYEGETDGAKDFMDLFIANAPWVRSSDYLQVFKLYGGWAVRDSTMSQLQLTVQSIRQRGLALAVEIGPLNPSDSCGNEVESFAGEEGIETLKRIKSAGGDLNFIAFDEPFFYGHFYDGPNACQWSTEKIATDIDAFIQRARAIFPDVIVGDIEPVTGPADDQAYKKWLDDFKAINGYDLAFLHLDVDWADSAWPLKIKSIEDYGRQLNIPVGIIYTGNFQDATSEAWLSIAGERVKRYELENGGQPAHVIFQSWNDKPDAVLPESDPYSFTGFIKNYIENKYSLGFPPGFNGNLALKKTVYATHIMAGADASLVVDGDPGTLWNSGVDAPQWIQIDLGELTTVNVIRLIVSQYPAGETVHQIWVGTNPDNLMLVHEFKGFTTDSNVLEFTPTIPLNDVQFVKIVTNQSPSWVAWREIEVVGE